MKCAHCGTDNTYKDRQPSGTCKSCKKKFVFEPKSGDPVTDPLFKNAIEAVSAAGRIRWGVEHLYYEVCRRKRGRVIPLLLNVAVLASGLALVIAFFASLGAAKGKLGFPVIPVIFPFGLPIGAILTGVGLVYLFNRAALGPRIERAKFDDLWQRWCNVNGTPPGVIKRAPQLLAPHVTEADVGHYSFDRAVICDRARTVDLFLANNFHFENNCAVLSIDGYPKGPFAIVKKMLMNNPRLQVYAVHDATPAACAMAHKLAYDKDWFAGKIKVIDLGLRPRHARPYRGLYLEADGAGSTIAPGIEAGEVQWLSQHRLEIAAARPEYILKRVHHGLQAHANDDFGSGGTMSCGSFDVGSGSDHSDSPDGGDSFG